MSDVLLNSENGRGIIIVSCLNLFTTFKGRGGCFQYRNKNNYIELSRALHKKT